MWVLVCSSSSPTVGRMCDGGGLDDGNLALPDGSLWVRCLLVLRDRWQVDGLRTLLAADLLMLGINCTLYANEGST